MRTLPLLKFIVALLLFWGWNSLFGTFTLMSLTVLVDASLPIDLALSLGLGIHP